MSKYKKSLSIRPWPLTFIVFETTASIRCYVLLRRRLLAVGGNKIKGSGVTVWGRGLTKILFQNCLMIDQF